MKKNAALREFKKLKSQINKIEEILDLNLSDIGDKSKIYLSLMTRYLIQ